jgi:O-antigen/teichoic acid export membrane protein
MGIVIRQSIKASIVSYAGAVIGMVSTIFIYPYFLTPELIGLNRILVDSAFLFAFVAQIGIPNAIIRFSPQLKKMGLIREAYRYALLLPIISFVFFGTLVFLGKDSLQGLFAENSPLFSKYFLLIIPFGLICLYMGIIENFALAYYRISIPKLIRDVFLRFLLIGSAILFFFLQLSIDLYIILVIVSYAVAVIILFSYFKRLQRILTPQETRTGIPGEIVRSIFPYMGFVLLAGIGSSIVTKVDAFMISSMIGLGSTGIYTISYFMSSIIEITSKVTLQISSPFVSESLENNDIPRLKDLYIRYSANQAIIGGLLFILLWANINSIFELMPNGDLYAAGKYVVLFIGLGKLIDVITGINNLILIYSKYYRYMILFVLTLGIITVSGNLILIPILGITGAAIASLSSYFLFNTIVIIFIYRKLKIQPFTAKSLQIFLLIFLAFVINYFLPTLENWFLDSLYRSLILLVIFVGFTYFYKLSEDLNSLVLKGIGMMGISRKKDEGIDKK